MQEFVKKLIERLEEEKNTAYNTYMNYEMNVDLGRAHGIVKAIEIVNQLAEEYENKSVSGDLVSRKLLIEKMWEKHKETEDYYDLFADELKDMFCGIVAMIDELPTVYNDGWIPCSERLPEVKKEVLIFADDNAVFVGRLMNGGFGVHDGDGWIDLKFILAWQPLPTPYQSKGE